MPTQTIDHAVAGVGISFYQLKSVFRQTSVNNKIPFDIDTYILDSVEWQEDLENAGLTTADESSTKYRNYFKVYALKQHTSDAVYDDEDLFFYLDAAIFVPIKNDPLHITSADVTYHVLAQFIQAAINYQLDVVLPFKAVILAIAQNATFKTIALN